MNSFNSDLDPGLAQPDLDAGDIIVRDEVLIPSADSVIDLTAPTGITAAFNPAAGQLSVFGNANDNNVTVSRNATGTILVNGGAVAVAGGTPTVANTALMQVFGQAGNDIITLDEANGALPPANLFGGTGNDVLIGGSNNDQIFGQADNDTLFGRGGNDFLFGGAGNDVLTGGDGDDQMFGEAGDDRMIWNPGDDNDLMEGGDGNDTAEVNGGNGAEVFTATANGTRVRFDRVSPAPFGIDIGTTENLVLNMNGGDDMFSAAGNLGALIKLTIDGGAGNDTILGGNGADTLLGGDGNDFIDGNQGNDTAFLGAGDDTFQWDPGDGSDTIEGQSGFDTLLFNGSAGNEIMEATANGGRLRFTRNLGNVVMDTDDLERVSVNLLGGADGITINDLSATDVTEVNVDLAGTIGGTTGDGAADVVTTVGTAAAETIDLVSVADRVDVLGLPAIVRVAHGDTGEISDAIVVNALGGNDVISAATLLSPISITIDGGAGDDRIFGSRGADTLIGGAGNDFIDGNQGNDTAFMGAGDDTFQWDPGDGSDTIEGQEGFDTLLFNGANVAENIDIVGNDGRAAFLRNVANITMNLNDVERIDFNALGGVDNIVVGDLSGTDVSRVNLDLAGANGLADAATDSITVNGTQAANVITVSESGVEIVVTGLPAEVHIANADSFDRLTITGQGGDDVINAAGLDAGIGLTLNGGLGADVFFGSQGNDLITGGDGNDVALMGAGDDTFVWNPGDDNDTIEGQAGTDTMLFNGANIAENINISANGSRAVFFRDVANVVMDLNDVERIDFNALGGADTITVNDLSGTDVTQVNIDLAATVGGAAGDAQADSVVVNGTSGADVIVLTLANGTLVVDGLPSRIVIEHFDAAIDTLRIVGLAGDDVIEASGVGANGMNLILDGGDGDDVIIGGTGNDTLLGGVGDDVLIGGPGNDILDGGPGSNVLIQ